MIILEKENYGEWAVVTGASSGVGKEIAQELASKGFNLVLIARDTNRLNAIASDMESNFHIQTKILSIDFAKKDTFDEIIKCCKDLEVGILINSAGYALHGTFVDHTLQEELDLLQVNSTMPLMLAHHFSKQMKERGKGAIVFLSSIMALAGASGWASYNASKAHNLILSEGIGEELKHYGVDVIALTPGSINSGFQERSGTKNLSIALSPKKVAKCGLWMLGCKKRTHTAGFINKIIALSTRLTPRRMNSKIFSFVVKQLDNKSIHKI